MRTWGRVTDERGNKTWVPVVTAPDGSNDLVYITTLIQVLLLNLNESPFYANYGIPAHQSVMMQIAPNYWLTLTQQLFAQYFASLTVTKVPSTPADPTPRYTINLITHQGVRINASVPVPR